MKDIFDASAYQGNYILHDQAVDAGFGGIFRSSIGTLVDGTFHYNMQRMLAHDGMIGAYHFYYAHRPINEQVEVWWDQIEEYYPLPLKCWWDVERATNRYANFTSQQLEDQILQASHRFKQLAGETWDGMYTSASAWRELLADQLSGAYNWLLWVAHYTTRAKPFLPLPWRLNNKRYFGWQYTDRGRVSWYRNGMYSIDLNRFRVDAAIPPQPPTNEPVDIKIIYKEDSVNLVVEEI